MIRADEKMASCFGVMAAARTASIVPLTPVTHHAPSGRVFRNIHLKVPQPVQGGSRLQCSGQGRKVDQSKASGRYVLLLCHHVLVCSAIAKMPSNVWL